MTVAQDNTETLTAIKNTVLSIVPDAKVLLFGSRARGDVNKHSDYDILVVTNDIFSPEEKMNIESKIGRILVYSLHAPFDVILHSQKDIDLKRHAKGFIIYHALKDAIEL